MALELEITVENQMLAGKRDINIYVNSSRCAYIISSGSSTKIKLKYLETEDFLHISVVKGPGDLYNNSLIDMPAWFDFQCKTLKGITLQHYYQSEGGRFLLKIPPGPPAWELKITSSVKSENNGWLAKIKSTTIILSEE